MLNNDSHPWLQAAFAAGQRAQPGPLPLTDRQELFIVFPLRLAGPSDAAAARPSSSFHQL